MRASLHLGSHLAIAAMCLFVTTKARADAVTDWNQRTSEFVAAAFPVTQPANRAMALAHTAAFEAANAITRRYPLASRLRLEAPDVASAEAAVAAAHRNVLLRLIPTQQAAIDEAYRTALATLPAGPVQAAGIAVGERAATELLALRADDGAAAPEAYKPFSVAGRYVPTTVPATPQWPQRKPWVLGSASQFRPGPPPVLASERWARDYNEIKAIGSRRSTTRSAEQTEIARFWETTAAPIYQGVVRSVALMPGRDLMRNARLFAAVTQALDDGMIATFEAKYHYAFWRPITAIRNGELDGNDATEAEPGWTPFITTPMHPEYPCAHCMQAGVVGAVLKAELRGGPTPMLSTSSVTADNAVRRWTSVDAFMQEVADARVYDGVHFRVSSEAGTELGQRIGALVMQRFVVE